MASARDGKDTNPLGLGPRDREGSGTGSTEDTSYDAVGSDPYTTGEPEKDFGGVERSGAERGGQKGRGEERVTPSDPDTSSSDEA
jgi:hypothetical protein